MMAALENLLTGWFLLFTLVLARTGALLMTAPIFGLHAVPRRVRALLAITVSLLVAPTCINTTLPPVDHLPAFACMLVSEVIVGLLFGLGVTILFSGIQVAGQIVSQMSGLSLADVFNPAIEEDGSVFSQLFYFLMLAVFVAIGGHCIVIEAILEAFAFFPPGHAALGRGVVEVVVNILTQSFVLGIRAAAPLLIALFLSNLVLGLISRTLPQINVIVVGFGINSLLTLGMLVLSLGAAALMFQEPAIELLHRIGDALVTY
jgi:flagellar biosynthetic protein FliR